MIETTVTFPSLDGINLHGTLRKPDNAADYAVLFVHGITVTREEDGFYTEFAKRLDSLNAISLRFDLRGHGKSNECSHEEVTLTGVINDIDAAFTKLCENVLPSTPTVIIAASFGAGLSSYWASENIKKLRTLVLLNPLFDYALRMLYSKPYWNQNKLTDEGMKTLKKQGWLPHGSFHMGRALVNELLHIKPYEKMQQLTIPVLTIHGDKDSMVPYEIAKRYGLPNPKSGFITIEGADHGFTHPDDEDFTHPTTIKNREVVFNKVIDWIRNTK